MTITGIEKRRKGMSALYIDGEYAMQLDTTTLLENRIKEGSILDDEQLHELIEASNLHRAKEKALYLITYRDHTKKELLTKIRRTCDEKSALEAAERMEEMGLVNDEEYAKRYARELVLTKKLSASAAEYKLMQKGIARDVARDIIEEICPEPKEQITALLETKFAGKFGDEKLLKRTVAALQRMGYRWGDIKSALNDCGTYEETEE
ncbi:MAG: RecX family transcriptional regulator [Bacillota bacterium]|nr:RecX family transcriptional regulator [Bacillota bacterium]